MRWKQWSSYSVAKLNKPWKLEIIEDRGFNLLGFYQDSLKVLQAADQLRFYILRSHSILQRIDVGRIDVRYNQISSEIAEIVSAASACFTDQTKCSLPNIDLALLENVSPPQIEGVSGEAIISGTVSKIYWETGHLLEFSCKHLDDVQLCEL